MEVLCEPTAKRTKTRLEILFESIAYISMVPTDAQQLGGKDDGNDADKRYDANDKACITAPGKKTPRHDDPQCHQTDNNTIEQGMNRTPLARLLRVRSLMFHMSLPK